MPKKPRCVNWVKFNFSLGIVNMLFPVSPRETLTRLLVEKGIFTKEEFLEMAKVADREMRRRSRANNRGKVAIFC